MKDSSGEESDRRVDFFVSYTRPDQAWAEWIGWVLEEAGFSVIVQVWDFRPGVHYIREMHEAVQRSSRTIAVLSAAYQKSAFASEEWQAAWADDPSGRAQKLLAFRVEDCVREGLLRQLVTVDLFAIHPDEARQRLLAAVHGQRLKPETQPKFPQYSASLESTPDVEPAFPGSDVRPSNNFALLLQAPLPLLADSLAVIATSLVIVIAATDASGSLKVAWAAPSAAAAFALRRIVHRSWPGLVVCLLSANAVGAAVEVWLEPTRGTAQQVVLTVFAASAVTALAVAGLSPNSVLGGRMLMAGDYIAASAIPIYFLALTLKGALGANGAAASLGLKMDAVAYFALSIIVAVYWGVFVLLRLAVPPPRG